MLRFYKIALLFFLLPVQYLKTYYLLFLNLFTNVINDPSDVILRKFSNKVSFTIDQKNYYYFSKAWLIFYGASFCIFIILMLWQCWHYYLEMQRIKLFSAPYEDPVFDKTVCSKLLSLPKRRQKIFLYKNPYIHTPITSGVSHPKIIIPCTELSPKEREFLYLHELYHIKNRDVLLRLLCLLVLIIHWFNPFAYLLFYKISQLCEYACDENVLKGSPDNDRVFYASLLVNMSICKESKGKNSFKEKIMFAQNFVSPKKIFKKRILLMKNITIEKKLKRLLYPFAGAVILSCYTLTAFAYNPPLSETIISDDPQDYVPEEEDYYFVPDGVIDEFADNDDLSIDYSESDCIFIDYENNQYSIADFPVSTQKICVHKYTSGVMKKHVKNASGGCSVYEYNAKVCSLCGSHVKGNLISTLTYTKCPHKT